MQLDYFDGTPGLMQRTEAEARRAKAKVVDAMDKQRAHVGRQMDFSDDRSNRAYKKDDKWQKPPTMIPECEPSSRGSASWTVGGVPRSLPRERGSS